MELSADKILPLHPDIELYTDSNSNLWSNQLHLSISVDSDSILYSIIDISNKKVVSMVEKKQYLSEWLETEDYFLESYLDTIAEKHKYKSVSVALRNEFYTLVPFGIFQANQIKSYLEINHTIQFPEQIRADTIYSLNAHCVHFFPEKLILCIHKIFPTCKLFHHTSVLCEMLIRENKFSKTTNVYIYMDVHHFDLIVFKNSKLLLCNNYKFETKQDVLFYFLNAIEQIKIQMVETSIFLMGKSIAQEEIKELLEVYSTNSLQSINIDYIDTLLDENENNIQRYYTNLTQHLCVL